MSWREGVAVAVVLLGLGAGAFLAAQRPSFWIEFDARLGKALLPVAWRYILRRMPPEEEAAWREAVKRGQGELVGEETMAKNCLIHHGLKDPPPCT